ncbi:hypothetical protein [Chitinophaga sp. OAE865]
MLEDSYSDRDVVSQHPFYFVYTRRPAASEQQDAGARQPGTEGTTGNG